MNLFTERVYVVLKRKTAAQSISVKADVRDATANQILPSSLLAPQNNLNVKRKNNFWIK
jgi:hypothetical protein